MDRAAQTSERVDDRLTGLLKAVELAGPFYYEPLSPDFLIHGQLCVLESLGYIRYCRYPEEFWVMLPAGKEFLSGLPRRP